MNESYKIDLNNRLVYPILNNVEKYLYKQMPLELDYYTYEDFARKNTESGEDFDWMLPLIIRSIENSIIYIESLTSERDNFLLTSIPGNEQRDFNLYRYNEIVIKQVNRIIDFIYRGLEYNIPSLFNDNNRQKLNLKQYFTEWYKEFSNDEIEPINIIEPLALTMGINAIKRLKWTGTPSQFGFIFDLLIKGGYLKRPTSNFTTDAQYFATLFEIDTTPGTLAKELSEKTNSLDTKNRNKFSLPPKDELIN